MLAVAAWQKFLKLSIFLYPFDLQKNLMSQSFLSPM